VLEPLISLVITPPLLNQWEFLSVNIHSIQELHRMTLLSESFIQQQGGVWALRPSSEKQQTGKISGYANEAAIVQVIRSQLQEQMALKYRPIHNGLDDVKRGGTDHNPFDQSTVILFHSGTK